MKKLIVLFWIIVSYHYGHAQGIEFEHTSLHDAIEKAKLEKKMVFVDCYTQWCGPCKLMAKKVFVLENVGNYFNQHFVNLKVDMETAEGRKIAEKYKVQSYPTLLWIDKDERDVHRAVGAGDEKYLLAEAAKAVNPESRWGHMEKRFKDGERTPEFLKKYIMDGVRLRMNVSEAAKAYLLIKPEEEYLNKEDFYVIASTVYSKDHPKFKFVFENKNKFKQLVDERSVNTFIENIFVFNLLPLMINDADPEFLNKQKQEIKDFDEAYGEQMIQLAEVKYLHRKGKELEYFQAFISYIHKYESDNASKLGQCAWEISNSKLELDKDILSSAIALIKKSVELDNKYYSNDTYAKLLERAGFHKKAKMQAQLALDLAPDKQKENLWSYSYFNK
jgi:thiol-disulfide isomerase/thioredoxin